MKTACTIPWLLIAFKSTSARNDRESLTSRILLGYPRFFLFTSRVKGEHKGLEGAPTPVWYYRFLLCAVELEFTQYFSWYLKRPTTFLVGVSAFVCLSLIQSIARVSRKQAPTPTRDISRIRLPFSPDNLHPTAFQWTEHLLFAIHLRGRRNKRQVQGVGGGVLVWWGLKGLHGFKLEKAFFLR